MFCHFPSFSSTVITEKGIFYCIWRPVYRKYMALSRFLSIKSWIMTMKVTIFYSWSCNSRWLVFACWRMDRLSFLALEVPEPHQAPSQRCALYLANSATHSLPVFWCLVSIRAISCSSWLNNNRFFYKNKHKTLDFAFFIFYLYTGDFLCNRLTGCQKPLYIGLATWF